MKKILLTSIISLLLLIAIQQTYGVAENTPIPMWVDELQSRINQTFQIQVKTSSVKEPDRIKQNEYFSFCLQGNGDLKKVPDPFEKMDRLFLSDGWKTDTRYHADGHGSSSFAYEKGQTLCLISMVIDSSCDDEETGHVPSEFWFTIYCKEKDKK